MMGPTVNQLWMEREAQWCEEANPFCFDLDGYEDEEPMTPDGLLTSRSSKSPCDQVERQPTPPPPRSSRSVLQSTKEHVDAFDQLLADIMKERDGAFQRAKSAIDRIEGVRARSDDAVSERQSASNSKGCCVPSPLEAVSCSDGVTLVSAKPFVQDRQSSSPPAPSVSTMLLEKESTTVLPSPAPSTADVQAASPFQSQDLQAVRPLIDTEPAKKGSALLSSPPPRRKEAQAVQPSPEIGDMQASSPMQAKGRQVVQPTCDAQHAKKHRAVLPSPALRTRDVQGVPMTSPRDAQAVSPVQKRDIQSGWGFTAPPAKKSIPVLPSALRARDVKPRSPAPQTRDVQAASTVRTRDAQALSPSLWTRDVQALSPVQTENAQVQYAKNNNAVFPAPVAWSNDVHRRLSAPQTRDVQAVSPRLHAQTTDVRAVSPVWKRDVQAASSAFCTIERQSVSTLPTKDGQFSAQPSMKGSALLSSSVRRVTDVQAVSPSARMGSLSVPFASTKMPVKESNAVLPSPAVRTRDLQARSPAPQTRNVQAVSPSARSGSLSVPSASAKMPGKNSIAALSSPRAMDVQDACATFAFQSQTAQINGKTDLLLQSQKWFPASEHPRCFAQSAAQLQEKLISHGIFATGSNMGAPPALAVAH